MHITGFDNQPENLCTPLKDTLLGAIACAWGPNIYYDLLCIAVMNSAWGTDYHLFEAQFLFNNTFYTFYYTDR